METATVPTRADLVSSAAGLVPLLRERAAETESARRIPAETVQALTDAGILRMRVPRRYGGYESDMRTTQAVVAELARGDGSVSWTVSVWMISTWIAGLFPDSVQDEIFSDPGTRVCGILSPTATAVPVDGGYVVNGAWSFNSGAQDSQWNTNSVLLMPPGGQPSPLMTAIPMKDLELVDDWYSSGLQGSGSIKTVARDVFVPGDYALDMGPVLRQEYSSVANADQPIYQAPLVSTASATVSGVAAGLARASVEEFRLRLPGRKITYTDYAEQSNAPLTHLQVAEATIKAEEATYHATRAADLVDSKNEAFETWTTEERARVRLEMGAACVRAKEAVDVCSTASGGSSIYRHVPIQRISRDVQALNLHGVMHPDTNYELYGRLMCGLDPNTHYL
ncbi:acyl-CoA dehydrogenase family protein [Aeromicrobium sp. CF3.5]|uniref:acyl-CoA dehydrogenase family protein n=1 Tax=Aeromicrobium sp. CF3.5 TaxID=3373078 RepID=UPI003EE777CA